MSGSVSSPLCTLKVTCPLSPGPIGANVWKKLSELKSPGRFTNAKNSSGAHVAELLLVSVRTYGTGVAAGTAGPSTGSTVRVGGLCRQVSCRTTSAGAARVLNQAL